MGEILTLFLVSSSSPMGLQHDMFIPAVMGQGTENQQRRWGEQAMACEIIGIYAQTELGHGESTCMHAHTCICITHTHTHTCKTHASARTHVHTHACTDTYTRTHTCTHTLQVKHADRNTILIIVIVTTAEWLTDQ